MAHITLLPNVFTKDYSEIPDHTWQAIRALGITRLELGATDNPFPLPLLAKLRNLGFTFLGHGSGIWTFDQHLDRFIAEARDLEEEFLICYWPWLDGATAITREQVSAAAAAMNRIGRKCRESGLKFAFHNHGQEFAQKLEGKMVCDLLLQETEPAFVALELDIYHVLKVGVDPLPFIKAHRERIPILHLNAMDDVGATPVVGDGIADFAALLQAAPQAGWVIEGHHQTDPLRFVRDSHARLAGFATAGKKIAVSPEQIPPGQART
jgi:sugar phosphate isomerase/epimerase